MIQDRLTIDENACMIHPDYLSTNKIDFNELFDLKRKHFIPCQTSKVVGVNKKSAILKDWSNNALTFSEALKTKTSMIALRLDDYLVFDCDSVEALNYVKASQLDEFENTFWVGRNDLSRRAYFFKLPDNSDFHATRINIQKDNGLLEIRTGNKQYQIIKGIHPELRTPYITNGKVPLQLTEAVILEVEKIYGFVAKAKSKLIKDYEVPKQFLMLLDNPFYPHVKPSLYSFISRDCQTLVEEGEAEPGRNIAAFKLATELIGTYSFLLDIEFETSDTPEDLYALFCQQCQPYFGSDDPREPEKVWQSALNQSRSPSLDFDLLTIRLESWINIQAELNPLLDNKKANTADKQSKNPLFSVDSISLNYDQIAAILDDHDYSNVTANNVKLVSQSIGVSLFGKNYLKNMSLQHYLENEVLDRMQIYQNGVAAEDLYREGNQNFLLVASKTRFDIPANLAESEFGIRFLSYCFDYGIKPEFFIVSAITAISSLFPSSFELKNTKEKTLPGNIFTLILGQSTSGKSTIIDPILNALDTLSLRNHNKFVNEFDNWLQRWEDWKTDNSAEGDLRKAKQLEDLGVEDAQHMSDWEKFLQIYPRPSEDLYTLSDINLQALRDFFGSHPDRGVLLCPDEYTTLAESIAQTASKVMGEPVSQKLLPMYNGTSTSHLRVSGSNKTWGKYRLSLLTTIQSLRFPSYFDSQDKSGIQSRIWFLHLTDFINIDYTATGDADTSFSEFLTQFFLDLKSYFEQLKLEKGNSDVTLFKFSPEAQYAYGVFSNQAFSLAQLLSETNKPQMQQWIGRLPMHSAKLSWVIHLLGSYLGFESDPFTISKRSVEFALDISRFLKYQLEVSFDSLSDPKYKNLSGEEQLCIAQFQQWLTKQPNKSCKVADFERSKLAKRSEFLNKWRARRANRDKLNSREIKLMFDYFQKMELGFFNVSKGTFILN